MKSVAAKIYQFYGKLIKFGQQKINSKYQF